MTARVLIAGGYGLVGSLIARHLRTIRHDTQIILAGRNPENGAGLAQSLGHAMTAYLDVLDPAPGLSNLGPVDLIVAALKDPGDHLIQTALQTGAAHIGITKTADDIAPLVFAIRNAEPKRPIVLLGHWQAGVLTIVARKACERFSRIERIEMAALYDVRDPIGPMTAGDAGGFVGHALVRESGQWTWVDARDHARRIRRSDQSAFEGLPMAVLDVPSLAAISAAANVRFDLGIGDSIGTHAGRQASHDLIIDISGVLTSGQSGTRRTIVSDPNGQAHLTALGVLVAIERVLGLDGRPAAGGGLHLPETLVQADAAIARFKQFGVQITENAWEPLS